MGPLGSRAFAGALSAEMVASAKDPGGAPLLEAMRAAGCDPDAALKVARPAGAYAAYLQLHVEQGPRRESAGLPVAIVEGIVGIRRLPVAFEGRPDHAGTTPMDARRDAPGAARRFVAQAEGLLQARGTRHTVWNVGALHVAPGVATIVPARAERILEFRDADAGVLEALEGALRQAARAVGQELGTPSRVARVPEVPPTPMDGAVAAALRDAAALGFSPLRLASGGGHDAMMMARLAPSGMLFVPSVSGRSPCPEEAARPGDIEAGPPPGAMPPP